jgi:hypothetical protein
LRDAEEGAQSATAAVRAASLRDAEEGAQSAPAANRAASLRDAEEGAQSATAAVRAASLRDAEEGAQSATAAVRAASLRDAEEGAQSAPAANGAAWNPIRIFGQNTMRNDKQAAPRNWWGEGRAGCLRWGACAGVLARQIAAPIIPLFLRPALSCGGRTDGEQGLERTGKEKVDPHQGARADQCYRKEQEGLARRRHHHGQPVGLGDDAPRRRDSR